MADSGVVLSDYRSSVKEINRLFLVGLFFALAAHCYVLEPYFALKVREQSLQSALPTMEQSIKVLTQEAAAMDGTRQSAAAALQEIREDLLRFPDQLRNALPDLQRAIDLRNNPLSGQFPAAPDIPQYAQYAQQQYMPQEVPGSAIALPAEITSLDAAVNWYVNNWFADLLAALETRVVRPVGELGGGSPDGARELGETGRNALDAVQKNINGIDPGFWHSYEGSGGKVDVAAGIRADIESAFTPLQEKVRELLEQTNRQRLDQEERLAALNTAIAATREKISLLSDRLKSIESPFGPLPLKLTDLIRLFPFLLVALAVKLAFVMQQGAAQQALFVRMTAGQTDAPAPQLLHYHLRSLLLAPASRALSLAAMAAWLTALLAVFCRSAWLISSRQQIIIDAGEQGILFVGPRLYQAGCLAGLALLAGTAAFMLKICWRSGEESKGQQRRKG